MKAVLVIADIGRNKKNTDSFVFSIFIIHKNVI